MHAQSSQLAAPSSHVARRPLPPPLRPPSAPPSDARIRTAAASHRAGPPAWSHVSACSLAHPFSPQFSVLHASFFTSTRASTPDFAAACMTAALRSTSRLHIQPSTCWRAMHTMKRRQPLPTLAAFVNSTEKSEAATCYNNSRCKVWSEVGGSGEGASRQGGWGVVRSAAEEEHPANRGTTWKATRRPLTLRARLATAR